METTKMTETATAATAATTSAATPAAPTAATRPLTGGELAFNYLIFGLSTAASIAFAYYLFTDPGRLVELWTWIRQLPILVQILAWLLLLPWMFALWIWVQPWALVIRIALVAGALLFTEYLVFPWKP
jgi:hypothetical protein